MKKDIQFPKVVGVELAIAKKNVENADSWYVYVMNKNDFVIENLLVTSSGYGEKGGKEEKTSILRHMIGNIDPGGWEIIESIQPEVFHLTNQYWVSYYVGGEIFDKKFIFLPDSIVEENLSLIPELNLMGILHK